MKEVRQEVREINGKFDTAIKVLAAPSIDHWKADMEAKIAEMVEAFSLSPVAFRGQLYAELEKTANVNLPSRVSRLKERMKKQGATHKERVAVTKLDVIGKDKPLRAIFEGIVKKHQAVYRSKC